MNKKLILLLMMLLLTACGGGTSGTSPTGSLVQKKFEGQLTDENGATLSNAKIEIQASGDTTTTDESGTFSILATVPVGKNDVIVTSKEGKRYLVSAIVAEDEETVVIRLIFSQEAVTRYRNWQLIARITGKNCETAYYDSAGLSSEPDPFGRTQADFDQQAEDQGYDTAGLIQVEELPAGTECSILIQVYKDGNPVSGLEYSASVRTCTGSFEDPKISFSPIGQGESDTEGEVQVPFTVSAAGVCGYEVKFPEFGDLRLGGLVSVGTKYAADNF